MQRAIPSLQPHSRLVAPLVFLTSLGRIQSAHLVLLGRIMRKVLHCHARIQLICSGKKANQTAGREQQEARIFPAEEHEALAAVHVRHLVFPCRRASNLASTPSLRASIRLRRTSSHVALLTLATGNISHTVEEVGLAIARVKRLQGRFSQPGTHQSL